MTDLRSIIVLLTFDLTSDLMKSVNYNSKLYGKLDLKLAELQRLLYFNLHKYE